MKLRLSLLGAWMLATVAPAAPLTVTWGAQSQGGALASASGLELPAGCLVRLGFFEQSLTQVREYAWHVESLEEQFTELARAHTGTFDGTQFSTPGSFAQTFAADSSHLPAILSTRTLCVWTCNAPTTASATEIGIFTSRAWKLTTGQLGGVIWDLNQIEADGLVVGSFSPTQSPTLGGQMNQLASLDGLADASDMDRDGVEFLLEKAFGMNEELPDGTLMPEVVLVETGGQTQTAYRFRRVAGGRVIDAATYEGGGFRYTVEVSDDLQNWRVDPEACQLHDSAPAADGFDLVTLGAAPRATTVPDFYRLKVERL